MSADTWLEDLHWMAGVFEGEGSIRIERPTARNMGHITADMVNTDETMVRAFQKMWEGYIVRSAPGGVRRPYWRWRTTSRLAQAFLLAMWPLLRTDRMREKCDLALYFQSQKEPSTGRRRSSSTYFADQWAMYEEMKRLNQRGANGKSWAADATPSGAISLGNGEPQRSLPYVTPCPAASKFGKGR